MWEIGDIREHKGKYMAFDEAIKIAKKAGEDEQE